MTTSRIPPSPSPRSVLEVELRWPARTVAATLIAADPLGFLFARTRAWVLDGHLVIDLPRSEAAAEVGGVDLDEVLGIYGESLALVGRVVDPMVDPVPRELPGDVPVVSADVAGWQVMAPDLVGTLVAARLGDAPFAAQAEQRAREWLADPRAEPWPDPDERLERMAGDFRVGGLGLPPERIDAHLGLVHELAEQLAGRPAVLDTLVETDARAINEWMWNLAARVADAGRVDDAVEVSEAMATFHTSYREEHLANAALALARASRGPEARPRLEALQAEVPDDRLVTTLCAEAYQAMGDAEAAEAAEVAYEHAVDVAVEHGEPDEVEDSLTTLATFHEVGGRPDDARSTRDRLQAWQHEKGWISAIVHPVRSGPKIGRNQPCPCGSGRKHKHCCGR